MTIEILEPSEEWLEARDYDGNFCRINIDGKEEFSAYDGEPEDNSLSRNFSDVWKIPSLLQMVYDAGKKGEDLILINKKIDDEE